MYTSSRTLFTKHQVVFFYLQHKMYLDLISDSIHKSDGIQGLRISITSSLHEPVMATLYLAGYVHYTLVGTRFN